MKKSRKDGIYVKKMHPYRRIMPFIMNGRNESVVYFDSYCRADKLLQYVKKSKDSAFPVDITHCLVRACAMTIEENPTMNQFILGRRIYKRKKRFITFSMKRKSMDKKSKLAVVKCEQKDGDTFRDLCERINEGIGEQRSEKKTYFDKELSLFMLVPRPVLAWAVSFLRWLDYHNILPHSFIENDGMYTSLFVANLGSLGMGPGYHHLYEWGNCPIFLMAGKIEDRPVVEDGELNVRPMLHLRWSYDERIDDGLTAKHGIDTVTRVLENPFEELGEL